MQCPACFAEIPDGSGDRCPECGKSTAPGRHSQSVPDDRPFDSASDDRSFAYSGGPAEPVAPLSLLEAIGRPLKLGIPGNMQNLLTACLISLIPLVGQIIIIGYYVEYVRKIVRRHDSWRFPDIAFSIDSLMEYGKKGFNFFIASIVYGIGIFCIIFAMMIPFWAAILAAFQAAGKHGEVGLAGCMALFTAILVPVILAFSVSLIAVMVVQIIFVYYCMGKLRFSDAFQIGPAFSLIMSDPMGYLAALVVLYIMGFITSGLTSVLTILLGIPIIGWIAYPAINLVLYFIMTLVTTSMFAEFYYRNAEMKGN